MLRFLRPSSWILTITALLTAASSLHAQDEPKQAPDEFRVKLETSAGDVIIEVHRKYAPLGVDQFHKAIQQGFYDECRFFRVVEGFVVQFGINGDPKVQTKWRESPIKDDPVKASNVRGSICFATAGKNTRTTQLFINVGNNSRLDRLGFAPFGKVTMGMDVVDKLTDKYGERPQQGQIQDKGNEYLKAEFPDLDYIKKATVLKADEDSDQ
jgi:peptidyl-prolyl cis-trans isomerase A (cyclophilin A)